MKKLSLISLGILASLHVANAQTISSKKWADLFSYNNVTAMKEDNGKIVAAAENGIGFGKLAAPLRAALAGRSATPSVFDMMLVIGRDETIARLTDAAG